jgi:hypothetical protein
LSFQEADIWKELRWMRGKTGAGEEGSKVERGLMTEIEMMTSFDLIDMRFLALLVRVVERYSNVSLVMNPVF